MNGVSTYGDTNVLAGTLAVGDAQHTAGQHRYGHDDRCGGRHARRFRHRAWLRERTRERSLRRTRCRLSRHARPATFAIHGDLTNNATINLAAASGTTGNMLNVSGNYVGNNAQLIVNTVMNAGGAASNQFTDQLVIGGNASGSTTVIGEAKRAGCADRRRRHQGRPGERQRRCGYLPYARAGSGGGLSVSVVSRRSGRPSDFYLRSALETVPVTPTPPVTPPVTACNAAGDAACYADYSQSRRPLLRRPRPLRLARRTPIITAVDPGSAARRLTPSAVDCIPPGSGRLLR